MSKQETPRKTKDMEISNNTEKVEEIDMVNSPKMEIDAETEHTTKDYKTFSDEIDINSDSDLQTDQDNTRKGDDPTKKSHKIDDSKIRIKTLEEQLDRTKDQMIRALADAENTRKRAVKERQNASKYAISNFARDIINVADNLHRALEAIPEEILKEFPQVKNLVSGIEATERELIRCFEKNGIGKLEPLNEKFDPNFHEVMFEAPMPEKENGTIIQIIEPGYIINGRILRPAKVGIAKNSETHQTQQKDLEAGQNIDTEA